MKRTTFTDMRQKINYILITKPYIMLIFMLVYLLICRISISYCIDTLPEINNSLQNDAGNPISKEALAHHAIGKSLEHVLKKNHKDILQHIISLRISETSLKLYLYNPIPLHNKMDFLQPITRNIINATFYQISPNYYNNLGSIYKGEKMFAQIYETSFIGISKPFMPGSMNLRFHAWNIVNDIDILSQNESYFKGIEQCYLTLNKQNITNSYQKEMIQHLYTVILILKNNSFDEAQKIIMNEEFYRNLYAKNKET